MRTSVWRCQIGRLTVPQIAAVLLLSGLAALLTGVIVGPNVADADRGEGGNCEARLANNSYLCDFRLRSGEVDRERLQFFVDDGRLVVSFSNTSSPNGACQCGATGSFTRPRFEASSEFFCLLFPGLILTGNVGPEGIGKGQVLAPLFNSTGPFPAVFRCEQEGVDN
jgi:hypothetical protein